MHLCNKELTGERLTKGIVLVHASVYGSFETNCVHIVHELVGQG